MLLLAASCGGGQGTTDTTGSTGGCTSGTTSGGGTTSSSGSSTSSGGADAGPPEAVCDLTQTGTLDLDAETVQIAFTVTLNHAPLTGALSQTSITIDGQTAFTLSQGGQAAVTLFVGTHALGVSSQDSELTTIPGGQSAVLVAQQPFTQDGAFALDIETVQLSGQITVNHQPPPAGLSSTEIVIGGSPAWNLQHGPQYQLTLLAGTYPVGVTSQDSALTTVMGGQSATLIPEANLTQTGTLNLDIEAVQLSGQVTVNHQSPPSGLTTTQIEVGGRPVWNLSAGAEYQATLLAGTYPVGVVSEDAALTTLQGGQSATLVAQANLTQTGTLNLDIETVQLSGQVTVNHQAPPSGLTSTQIEVDGSPVWNLTSGPQYQATLLGGTHSLGVFSEDAALTTLQGGQSATLVSQANLTQTGTLNLDIETVQLSGQVTVNHQAPPSGLTSTQIEVDGSPVWNLTSGPQYQATLLSGTYPVGVFTDDSSLTSVQGGQAATLVPRANLTQTGTLNLDLETIQLSGQITVNHAPPPGGLSQTALDVGGAQCWSLANGAAYAVTLLAEDAPLVLFSEDASIVTLVTGETLDLCSQP